MKFITKKELLPLFLIIAAFMTGIYLYPKLSDFVPSHWNSQGEIDAYSGKTFAVFFFPILTFVIYLMMTFMPLIDPLRKNYLSFAVSYFWFRTAFVVFLLALYLFTIFTAVGFEMNIIYFILPLLSVLFIFIGFFLPKVKKNYFVGIRTPWTLHSEAVWDDTHKVSGKIFMTAGIISLIGLLFPAFAFSIFLTAVVVAGVSSVAYSYFSFKKHADKS